MSTTHENFRESNTVWRQVACNFDPKQIPGQHNELTYSRIHPIIQMFIPLVDYLRTLSPLSFIFEYMHLDLLY